MWGSGWGGSCTATAAAGAAGAAEAPAWAGASRAATGTSPLRATAVTIRSRAAQVSWPSAHSLLAKASAWASAAPCPGNLSCALQTCSPLRQARK
eukprot:6717873-Lingulodinium_polyedra.AAC.1